MIKAVLQLNHVAAFIFSRVRALLGFKLNLRDDADIAAMVYLHSMLSSAAGLNEALRKVISFRGIDGSTSRLAIRSIRRCGVFWAIEHKSEVFCVVVKMSAKL